MRLLLIGAPGAGKGTQAVRLAERLGIAHISSGDLLRQHVTDETTLGKAVELFLAGRLEETRRFRYPPERVLIG